MKEEWIICHDNGVPGQEGFTDGFRTETEVLQFIESAESNGIKVLYYWCQGKEN